MSLCSRRRMTAVLAAAAAVGLGLVVTACGGSSSQTSAAPVAAAMPTATVAAPLTTSSSVPADSATSATTVDSSPAVTSERTKPSPTGAQRAKPPTQAVPAWLPDPHGAYGWQQSQPQHSIPWDVTSNESLCYGLNQASQIEEQGFRAEHRNATARMQSFRYADPTAAASAYATGLQQMASCQDQLRTQQGRSAAKVSPDATVVVTAAQADGHAWSAVWTGVATPMSSAGRQVDRVYLVLRGSTVTLLEADDFSAGSPATDDPAVLAGLGR